MLGRSYAMLASFTFFSIIHHHQWIFRGSSSIVPRNDTDERDTNKSWDLYYYTSRIRYIYISIITRIPCCCCCCCCCCFGYVESMPFPTTNVVVCLSNSCGLFQSTPILWLRPIVLNPFVWYSIRRVSFAKSWNWSDDAICRHHALWWPLDNGRLFEGNCEVVCLASDPILCNFPTNVHSPNSRRCTFANDACPTRLVSIPKTQGTTGLSEEMLGDYFVAPVCISISV